MLTSTTTMQRRSHASDHATTKAVNGTTHSPAPRSKQKRTRRGRFRALQYGTRKEALLQVLLLGGLLFLLIIYTAFRIVYSSQSWNLPFMRPPPLPSAESMSHIGDKSKRYLELRQKYDDQHPEDPSRSRAVVLGLHENTYETFENPSYDIYNCPDTPPPNYPYAWNIMDVLGNWPPDDTTPRPKIYQGLCVFDYHHDYDKAMKYRDLEVPFVVQGDPAVHKTVERWNDPTYMHELMGDTPHRTEYSPTNHFMYWVPPHEHPVKPSGFHLRNKSKKNRPWVHTVDKPDNWTQPTEQTRMPFQEWLDHANVTDDQLGPDQPHWYYRLIGCGEMNHGNCDLDSSEYLFDELPWMQPKQSLYIKDPSHQRGIHCRFGMKGVIAENHFDGSRNFIAVLRGERRYILSHPNQCKKLALYPMDHPSGRHSAIDWSDPDLEKFPEFVEAKSNEVVLQAGDTLYLPTNYFHYIISLGLNYQCNSRSGISPETMPDIRDCGF